MDPERDLDKVGAHCALKDCNSLDFLPNVCEGCKKLFCLDHAKVQDHACPTPPVKIGGVTITCHLCDSILPVPAGSYENDVLSAHTKKGCPKKASIAQHKCTFCPKMEAIKIVCPNCKNNFCLKHRLERDHNCKKRVNPPLQQTIPPHLQNLLNQLRNSKPVKTNS
ncbi:hypothetical protein DICPUDRAFT_56665 [Dictyostelium purpureum]|uniref:AN1-type domain-containing protein n=1 Tax=Dictyostelium purpureum TaxID=5786 RepID=F0ZSH5_DICPU|nr:uncharacterized protein DICPUDRAFT_56665 [Dictyostelium purpureum]EGC33091.1 hypothetical protein DICPUDRAFT_56665 [Dictyostelium purpureum]|eukprot:XP_003290368.1 hypothetical protein DICPUDRAFT_56665 [Dictyostelium purpureum]